MRKNNKRKGFTIVELVIVIAVISILAAVMIPTISGVVADAKEAAAKADAKSMYTEYKIAHPDAEADYVAITEGSTTTYYAINDGYAASTTKTTTSGDVIISVGTCTTDDCGDCGYTFEKIGN